MKSVRRRDKRGLFVLLGMFVMIFLFTFLSRSFDKLNEQFVSVYSNIEAQNYNVNQMNYIFEELSHRASDMHNSSSENQNAVASIAAAMKDYRNNIDKVVKNTQSI